MVDHDCVAYSNTVEIFFTQQDQLQQLSLNVVTTFLQYYTTIVDIQTKVQDIMLRISQDFGQYCEPTTV